MNSYPNQCRSVCALTALLPMLAMLYFTQIFTPVRLHAQSQCRAELSEAESRYNEGRFDEAIDGINRCLSKSGLTEDERKLAYMLLGKTYLAKDYLNEARQAVKKLLEVVPNFEADPVQDPPAFIKMVADMKIERAKTSAPPPKPVPAPSEKKSSKKWLWIGAGAVVAGGAAALLLSGGGEGGEGEQPDLPGVPSLPETR